MPTLQEMLLNDFGVEQNVKTASASAGSEEIDALAARYGFDFAKTASDDKDEDDKGGDKDKEEAKDEDEKKASVGLSAYFNTLFPEDGDLNKTAEELEKVAHEENLGARAYDHFAARWDRRVEKIASEVLSGSATISASTAADHDGSVHQDPTIAQAGKTNRPANASDKINTSPVYTDEIHSKDDARTLGHLEQKHAAVSDMAMRKALILAQLER